MGNLARPRRQRLANSPSSPTSRPRRRAISCGCCLTMNTWSPSGSPNPHVLKASAEEPGTSGTRRGHTQAFDAPSHPPVWEGRPCRYRPAGMWSEGAPVEATARSGQDDALPGQGLLDLRKARPTHQTTRHPDYRSHPGNQAASRRLISGSRFREIRASTRRTRRRTGCGRPRKKKGGCCVGFPVPPRGSGRGRALGIFWSCGTGR